MAMNNHPALFIRTIAFYTLLEALRNRAIWLISLLLVSGFGLALFIAEVALTETRQIQTAILAATFRLGAIFILSSIIITSIVREFNDKGLELVLSLPLSKSHYLIGKFLGFSSSAFVVSLLCGFALLPLADADQLFLWSASLLCELLVVCAFSLFCVMALEQIVAALATVFGFYLLARVVGVLQLISHGLLTENTFSQSIVNYIVDIFALLLPRLDRFTQTEWLVNSSGQMTDLLFIVIQSLIYIVLLMAAGVFDFYRKNF